MKLNLKKSIVFFLLLHSCYLLNAQNADEKATTNKFIKISNDTLRSVVFKSNSRFTNEDQLTYIQNGKTNTVRANDVLSYFDGSTFYHSESVQGLTEKKFIKRIVVGPLIFGQSLKKDGSTVFYLKKENDNEIVSIEPYKYKMEFFLKDFIADYKDFKAKYNKRVCYDYASLGEFASAYNAYKSPKTYIPLDFKYPEQFNLGFFCSINYSGISFNGISTKYDRTLSYSVGVCFNEQYSRMASIDILSSFSYSSNSSKDKSEKINFETIGFEPSLGLTFYINPYLRIKANVGGALCYNVNSWINLDSETSSAHIKGINIGYTGGVSLILKSKYSVFINYLNYSFKTDALNPLTNQGKRKGAFDSFRFGFVYYL